MTYRKMLLLMTSVIIAIIISGCGTQAWKDGYDKQGAAMRNLQYHMDNPDVIEERDDSKIIRYNVGGESGWAIIKGSSVTIYR